MLILILSRVRVEVFQLFISGNLWVNLTQKTIISTIVGRNPLEEME